MDRDNTCNRNVSTDFVKIGVCKEKIVLQKQIGGHHYNFVFCLAHEKD